MNKINKLQEGMQGSPLSFDPQILSQMMSAQGAGQGIDYNGEPTPNISGEPSFADMAQEIQERYDKLIIPLQRKLEKLKAKLKENPTDQTIKNEIERLEQRIDQLEQQEDMELQQLEAEVEKSGEIIDQQKQMEGYADMNMPQTEEMQEPVSPDMEQMMMPDGNGEMPMMQFGGNVKKKQDGKEAWERSNTFTLPLVTVKNQQFPWFYRNPLFKQSDNRILNFSTNPQKDVLKRIPVPRFEMPNMFKNSIAQTEPATTTPLTTTSSTTTTTEEENNGNWLNSFLKDLKDRPFTDYLQVASRLGETVSNYADITAEEVANEKMLPNPYYRNIDAAMQSKNDNLAAINRNYQMSNAANRRDVNRMMDGSQFASLQHKFATNNALYDKLLETLAKSETSKMSDLTQATTAHDERIGAAIDKYNDYEANARMFEINNRNRARETRNLNRNRNIKNLYDMLDLLSKAAQDQRDYNYIKGPFSNNYLNFLASVNAFQNLTPEEQLEALQNASKQKKQKQISNNQYNR